MAAPLTSLLYFGECIVAHGKVLPSVQEKALGKACFAESTVAVCGMPCVFGALPSVWDVG